MQTEWSNHWTAHENVWVTYFCWSNRKITGVGKASRTDSSVVPRHGGTCSNMRWAILPIGKQKSGATVQSFKSLPGWPSIQAGGSRIGWRIFRSLLTNCLDMLVLGTNFTTWHPVVSEHACEITQACDRRLARLISYIHHTNDSRQYFHVGNTALHCRLGLFHDSDFAGDLEDSKSSSGGGLVYVWKQNICPSQLDMQETNCCLAQFHKIWNHFCGCWITYGWLLALDHWDIVIEVFRSTTNKVQPKHTSQQETGAVLDSKNQDSTRHKKTKGWAFEWSGLCTHQHTFFSRWISVVHLWRQRSRDQNDNKRTKPNDGTRVKDPQSCPWLVVWQNQFGTQKSKSSIVNTKNQLADILTKGSFSREEWNHLLCLFRKMNFSMLQDLNTQHWELKTEN